MLETHSTKAAAVGESNNAGIWGRSPQLPEANGGLGVKLLTLRRFYRFFPKIRIFRLNWSKFLLKTAFLNG